MSQNAEEDRKVEEQVGGETIKIAESTLDTLMWITFSKIVELSTWWGKVCG